MTVSGKLTDRSLADIARRLEEFRPRLDGYADSLHRSGVYLRLYAEGLYEPFEPLVAHLGLWERICWRLQRRTAVMNQEALFTFLETQARMPACEAVRRENSFAVHGPGNPVRYGHVDKESAEGWQTALSAAVRSQAVFDLVALRVALCRYRLAKKRYPQTLEELVPTYLEKAPVDPFSGKLYRYRSADQGFLAWSIAGDLVDNSGKCEAPYEPDLRITEDKGPGESD